MAVEITRVFSFVGLMLVAFVVFLAVEPVQAKECKDKLSNCNAFADSACQPPYKGWAYDNCRKRCNLCEESHCVSVSCPTWSLGDSCHMEPPAPGKCCPRPKCPPPLGLKFENGYKDM